MSYNNIRLFKSCPQCNRSLASMVNEECQNTNCGRTVKQVDEVNDFTLSFLFDDIVDTAESEHVQCYRRALGTYIADFTEENELTPMLDTLLDRPINVTFSHKKNSDGLRVIDKINFLT